MQERNLADKVEKQLTTMLQEKIGFKPPIPEMDLIIGIAKDMLQKQPKLEEHLTETLTAALAAAKYVEMKLLEKECRDLQKKIQDPANTEDKDKLTEELVSKLKKLYAFTPKDQQKSEVNKDLNNSDFAENLQRKIKKDRTKEEKIKDEKSVAKENKEEEKSASDFAMETNQMLLGVLNPSIITGNPIVIKAIAPNMSGIVDVALELTNDALSNLQKVPGEPEHAPDPEQRKSLTDVADTDGVPDKPSPKSPFKTNPFDISGGPSA